MRAAPAAISMIRLAIAFFGLATVGLVLALSSEARALFQGVAPGAALMQAGKWAFIAFLLLAGAALLPGRRTVS
jgi:hypothetical protein